MKKKVAIIIGVVVVALAGIGIATSSKNTEEQIQTVAVDTVTTQTVVSTVDADGIVAFRDKISVYAENTGKVNNIPVNEGDSVNAGDILINYDRSGLDTLERQLEEANLSLKSANITLEGLNLPTDESQLKQLEAQITQTENTIIDLRNNITQLDSDIANAEKDYNNANLLYSQGAISKTELDTYEKAVTNLKNQRTSSQNSLDTALTQLEANKSQYEMAKDKTTNETLQNQIANQKVVVQQAQLRVNQLTEDINDFQVTSTSPITGTVVKIYVTDGEAVTEGKIVAEVGDLNDLVIEASIPEYDMDGVAVGQKVTISSDAISEEYEGQITKVYPLAETITDASGQKSVVKVEISMPQNTSLKAGYTTDLTITTNTDDNAVVIPIMAYMSEKVNNVSREYVYVVKEDGTLEKRTITVKEVQNSVASVEGLSVGEKVVSSPTEDMTEGMKINAIDNSVNQ